MSLYLWLKIVSNTFAIWSEGYPAYPKPKRLGYGVGETFKDACLEWAKRTLGIPWLDKDKLIYGGIPLHKSRVSAEKKRKKKKF